MTMLIFEEIESARTNPEIAQLFLLNINKENVMRVMGIRSFNPIIYVENNTIGENQ